jgi:glycine betaine/proline transport system ATP-binding protein
VADFVAHMNPLGVLCARDVMEPISDIGAPDAVGPETNIREVMDRVRQTGRPVPVKENGKIIGQITKESVLAKLVDPRG